VKRKLLRYLSIALAVLLFAGYFAFQTFFFSPFEGAYGYDVASLVPRDVDFFVAKADLKDDFTRFPELAVAEDFAGNERAQAFLELEAIRELLAGADLDALSATLDENLATLPLDVDPLDVLGGRDVAVAGYLRGNTAAEADWVIAARTNWMGKLGYELLSYPGLLDLQAQGLTVEERAIGKESTRKAIGLSGGALARQLFLTRIQDVLVVATQADLVERAVAFDVDRGEGSFGQSAKYGDNIDVQPRAGNELELYVDQRAFRKVFPGQSLIPEGKSDVFWSAFVPYLFDESAINELMGTARFAGGVTLRKHGTLSSEDMTGLQKRLYRARDLDKKELLELASPVPADVGLYVSVRANIGDLLRAAVEADPDRDRISNLEDLARKVWGHPDLMPLIDDIDSAFRDRIGFAIREHDYPDEGEDGPPHNGEKVFVWALILRVAERSKVEELRTRITARQVEFGIQGRGGRGTAGVFEHTVSGGVKVLEYWNELVPGTGHISTVLDGDWFIISNHHLMINQMVDARYEGRGLNNHGAFHSIVSAPEANEVSSAGMSSAQALVWLNPRAMSNTRYALAAMQAERDARNSINWSLERPRIEKLVLAREFPGQTWGRLSPEVEQQLAIAADPDIQAYEQQVVDERMPQLMADYRRLVRAQELFQHVVLELAIDQKRFDLFARLATPVE
jgi:hypothetical protein